MEIGWREGGTLGFGAIGTSGAVLDRGDLIEHEHHVVPESQSDERTNVFPSLSLNMA